jgi:hypothetical protein
MKKEEACCNNNFGLASVILGIVGLVGSIVVIPAILSIISLIFGIIQYRRAKNKWAIWGIALSIAGIIIAVIVIMKLVGTMSEFQNTMNACIANPSLPGCEDILKFVNPQ